MLSSPRAAAHVKNPQGRLFGTRLLPPTGSDALRQGLKELGYVEGETIIIERRSAEGKENRFADLCGRASHLKVDVIVVVGTAAARGGCKAILRQSPS